MKEFIKKIIKRIPIAFTKNQLYDKHTVEVIRKACQAGTNCVDVGCHKGEILDIILKYAPDGQHFGFEPIPDLYKPLSQKYKEVAHISDIALSNKKSKAEFNYVITNPAYSGLQKRDYDRPDEKDTKIEVHTDLLDNVLPKNVRIGFMKIDVEGGELLVLEGAKKRLEQDRPIIIFEHGLGASEHYGSTPKAVFQLLSDCGMEVSLMERWLKGKPPFSCSEFEQQYYDRKNYYFIAYPKQLQTHS